MENTNSLPEAFADKEGSVNVIIETPRNSRVKYAYNPARDVFEIRKILPAGMVFSYNFGFIPNTVGGDGDPVDILMLHEEPLAVGCHLVARLIGAVAGKQTQDGETFKNDRVIGVIFRENVPARLEESRLTPAVLEEIKQFFVNYNQLQGRMFKVTSTGGAAQARQLVLAGMKKAKKS